MRGALVVAILGLGVLWLGSGEPEPPTPVLAPVEAQPEPAYELRAPARPALDSPAGDSRTAVRAGAEEDVALDEGEAAEVDLRHSGSVVLEVELVDSDGERIAESWVDQDSTTPTIHALPDLSADAARFQFGMDGGRWRTVRRDVEDDGLYRIPLDFPLDRVERLRVGAPGYRWRDAPASEWRGTGPPVRLGLERLPAIRVDVVAPALAEGESLGWLEVRACTRDASSWALVLEEGDAGCCGLGSSWSCHQIRRVTSLVLPVYEERAYSVAVVGASPAIFGPFVAGGSGDEVHRLELDRSFVRAPPDPEQVGSAVGGPEGGTPPSSRSQSEAAPPRAPLVLRFRRADGAALAEGTGATVWFETPNGDVGRGGDGLSPGGELHVVVPPSRSLLVDVVEPDDDGMEGAWRVLVEDWSDGIPLDVVLAPRTEFVVRLRLPYAHRFSPVELEAVLEDEKLREWTARLEASGWEIASGAVAVEHPPAPDGTRTFRLSLGPGSYRVEARCSVADVAPARVELGSGGGTRTVELEASF